MRVVFINRRQLGVTIILIGLMLILFVFEKNFDDKLKLTLLIQNDIKYMTQYNTGVKDIIYKLPSEWENSVENFSGGEILYHNDFQSDNSVIHGYVQVLNIKKDLKTYLDQSRIISQKQNKIYNYNINTIKIKNYNGFLINYKIESKSNLYICNEYFVNVNGEIVRFSFFVRESNYKENMPTIFSTIVKTIDTYSQ